MDIRQLRYFLTICEEGSLSRAAQSLDVAQPALSQQIRKLEKDLGVGLLIRGSRGVHPTEAGERLAYHARMILRQMDWARENVSGCVERPSGQASIGLPASVAMVLTVPLVEAVRQRLPEVSLRLVEGLSGNILEWLHSGRLDVALLFDAERLPGLESERMVSEELYLVGPVTTAGAGEDTVALVDLRSFPLILPGRPHGLREIIDAAARDIGIRLNFIAEIDGLAQIKALVVRGIGYTVLSQSAVHQELRQGTVSARRIVEPAIRRSVSVCTLADSPMSAAARAARAVLVEVMGDLVRQGVWPGRS